MVDFVNVDMFLTLETVLYKSHKTNLVLDISIESLTHYL